MRGIQTKYLPTTNYKPARIKAFWSDCPRDGSITISYDYALDSEAAHRKAALAFIKSRNNDDTKGLTFDANGLELTNGYVFAVL